MCAVELHHICVFGKFDLHEWRLQGVHCAVRVKNGQIVSERLSTFSAIFQYLDEEVHKLSH